MTGCPHRDMMARNTQAIGENPQAVADAHSTMWMAPASFGWLVWFVFLLLFFEGGGRRLVWFSLFVCLFCGVGGMFPLKPLPNPVGFPSSLWVLGPCHPPHTITQQTPSQGARFDFPPVQEPAPGSQAAGKCGLMATLIGAEGPLPSHPSPGTATHTWCLAALRRRPWP